MKDPRGSLVDRLDQLEPLECGICGTVFGYGGGDLNCLDLLCVPCANFAKAHRNEILAEREHFKALDDRSSPLHWVLELFRSYNRITRREPRRKSGSAGDL